MRSDTEPTE